ncbi:hypothetical protein DRP04_15325, partial [Archaeoglobales archaeon]
MKALDYYELGLSVIPLEYKNKKPVINWKPYQERQPTREEVINWFSNKPRNVGIVCGKVSGNLFVIDIDNEEGYNRFMEKIKQTRIEELVDNTWIVRTGKGYHIYFRCEEPVKSRRFKGCDVKGEGGYVVAPPSVHPSGNYYSFVKKGQIVLLSKSEFDELIRILESLFSEQSLESDKLNEIVELFLPYWQPGRRHWLALMLAGAFYHNGRTLEDCKEVVKRICKRTGDEETKDRLRAVEDTFKRAAKDIPVAYKALKDEVALEEFEELCEKLLTLIKGDFIYGFSSLWIKRDQSTYYVLSFKSKDIKKIRIDRDGNRILKGFIAKFIPIDLTLIQGRDAEVVKVELETPDGNILKLQGTIGELVSFLKEHSVRVTSYNEFRDAFNLIINKMIEKGLCKIERGEAITGIVLDDEELKALEINTELPSSEELREALELLNKFVELSSFSPRRIRKLAAIIRWFTVSAFKWCFKQLGLWLPDLYIYGESDTGKTKTAQFLSNIWKEQPMGSIGTIDSSFRFGLAASRGTLPVIINEMNFDELGSEIIEMWKTSVDQKKIRTRYGRDVNAYAPLCFTSNSHLPVERAIRKRLVFVNFDITDIKELQERKEEFERLFLERSKLNAIGRFAFSFVSENPQILEVGWDRAAIAILKAAYKHARLEQPKWVGEECDEDESALDVKEDYIRTFIRKEIIRAGYSVTTPIDDVLFRIEWLDFQPKKERVIIRPAFVRSLEKEGITISSLRD